MTLNELFSEDIRIETSRLMLRKITPADARDMYEYASDPRTSEYLLWYPHPSLAYTKELIARLRKDTAAGRYYDLAVILKDTGRMIGTAGFTSYDHPNAVAELGYVISPAYWHRGIAPEALEALLSIAFFELKVNRAECKYMVGNENSRRVMEKCGMTFEGIMRGKMIVKGTPRDIGYCSVLRDEYFSVPRQNVYTPAPPPGAFSRLFLQKHR